MVVADFVNVESLINTRSNYQIDHSEIEDLCQFRNYDCSVVWTQNFTYINDGCPNAYKYLCVSFNKYEGSFDKKMNQLYEILIFESLFQFFLCVLWTFSYFLMSELYIYDRWTGIKKKLNEWNQIPSKNAEMKLYAPFLTNLKIYFKTGNQNKKKLSFLDFLTFLFLFLFKL